MRTSFILPALAVAVAAQSSSDDFPQTSFLTMTNSQGVITGMPPVETSQPPVPPAVTSQPAVETSVGEAASIPAVGTGVHTLLVQGTAGVNSTQTIVVSANNSTTVIQTTIGVGPSSTAESDSPTGTDSEGNPTATDDEASSSASETAEPTGGAAAVRAVASVAGLGAVLAAFL
ncbi:hypothetical protein M011DRAFT_445516 [Sporormia fimetaria CBS 119925]|uniref:GPI anchored protein n=1 Tax=Sporormia fimetaria CBS 119925 TaxID=1340428 RepID=A0A6A6VBU7_9PLEO|nr:hypothetical protein M011DRAFT_445516 [Sporormia fimetaria CBS 119925]